MRVKLTHKTKDHWHVFESEEEAARFLGYSDRYFYYLQKRNRKLPHNLEWNVFLGDKQLEAKEQPIEYNSKIVEIKQNFVFNNNHVRVIDIEKRYDYFVVRYVINGEYKELSFDNIPTVGTFRRRIVRGLK